MPRRHWKQPVSISLDKDVLQTLRKVARHLGVSLSSVVQQAIIFLAAQPGNLPEGKGTSRELDRESVKELPGRSDAK